MRPSPAPCIPVLASMVSPREPGRAAMPDMESIQRVGKGACRYRTCNVPRVSIGGGRPATGWRAGVGARALRQTGQENAGTPCTQSVQSDQTIVSPYFPRRASDNRMAGGRGSPHPTADRKTTQLRAGMGDCRCTGREPHPAGARSHVPLRDRTSGCERSATSPAAVAAWGRQ
jgi:hypothetical protein